MTYISIDQFIKKHLRFKQHWNKKVIGMSDAVWQPLEDDTFLNECTYAKGSLFKVFETKNFGWIVFGPGTLTANGNTPNRRILKW